MGIQQNKCRRLKESLTASKESMPNKQNRAETRQNLLSYRKINKKRIEKKEQDQRRLCQSEPDKANTLTHLQQKSECGVWLYLQPGMAVVL